MEVYNKSLCKPRELLVEILQEYPEEVEHIFIPSCVVLTRCAGCCNDEIMQCTPTSTYNITMEVSNTIYNRNTLGVCAVGCRGGFLLNPFLETLIYPDMSLSSVDGVVLYFCPNVTQRGTYASLISPDASKWPSGNACCLLKDCSGVTFWAKINTIFGPIF